MQALRANKLEKLADWLLGEGNEFEMSDVKDLTKDDFCESFTKVKGVLLYNRFQKFLASNGSFVATTAPSAPTSYPPPPSQPTLPPQAAPSPSFSAKATPFQPVSKQLPKTFTATATPFTPSSAPVKNGFRVEMKALPADFTARQLRSFVRAVNAPVGFKAEVDNSTSSAFVELKDEKICQEFRQIFQQQYYDVMMRIVKL